MSKQENAAFAFALTTKYDPPWIRDTAPGENALCQVECLASHLSWVEWRKPHWAKTGLVVLAWAENLPESSELLRMYVDGKPPAQAADSIMRAVPLDRHGLIALFCLVARKR